MTHAHTFACEPIAKADKSKLTEIERLAESLEPALARAVRDLLQEHADRIDLDDLEQAIRTGSAERVLRVIGGVDEIKAGAARQALENAVWAGGALGGAAPALTEARFVFNRLNPALITWLEGYSLNLIREIDNGTIEAVRARLITGMTDGRNPIDQARSVRAVVGLTGKQAQSVRNYEAFLRTVHMRRSVKRMGLGNERSTRHGLAVLRLDEKGRPKDGIYDWRLRDQRFDTSIERAVANRKPLTEEQIAKQVAAYQRRFIQHRARTIARTEALRATNVGVYEAWRQAAADGRIDGALVRKEWILSYAEGGGRKGGKKPDDRVCVVCAAIPGANPKGRRLDEAFQSPKGAPLQLPPAHPSCRCVCHFRLFEPIQLEE